MVRKEIMKIIEDVRKLTVAGGGTYYVTIPLSMIKDLRWRKGQRLVIRKKGKEIIVRDYEA